MPRTPFGFTNLIHLLEYLATHSAQPAAYAAFNVKLTLDADSDFHESLTDGLTGPLQQNHAEIETISFRCAVEGVAGVAALFQDTPYTVEKVEWRAHGNTVRVDCGAREVQIDTDSIAFVELCRHKMTGQGVRKFTVDLKIQ